MEALAAARAAWKNCDSTIYERTVRLHSTTFSETWCARDKPGKRVVVTTVVFPSSTISYVGPVGPMSVIEKSSLPVPPKVISIVPEKPLPEYSLRA